MKSSWVTKPNFNVRHCERVVGLSVIIILNTLFPAIALSFATSQLLGRYLDLEARIIAFLRWANYRHHENEVRNYGPEKAVMVKTFYPDSQVLVYIPEIEAWRSFAFGTGGQLVAMNNGSFYRSFPEALAKRLLNSQPWPRVKSASPARVTIEDRFPREKDVQTRIEERGIVISAS